MKTTRHLFEIANESMYNLPYRNYVNVQLAFLYSWASSIRLGALSCTSNFESLRFLLTKLSPYLSGIYFIIDHS